VASSGAFLNGAKQLRLDMVTRENVVVVNDWAADAAVT
jgi:hypothetical protein